MNPITKKSNVWQKALRCFAAACTFLMMPVRAGVGNAPAPPRAWYETAATPEEAPDTHAETRPAPETILRKMVSVYQTLHSYQDETWISVRTQSGRILPDLEIPFALKWQQPNKLLMKFFGSTLISDGQSLWNCLPKRKQCLRKKTPQPLRSLDEILAMNPITRMAQRSIVLALLTNNAETPFMTGIVDGKLSGIERVGEDEVYVIDVTDTCQTKVRFWIGKSDSMIYKAFADYTDTVGATAKDFGTQPAFITETHKYMSVNKRLSGSTFQISSRAETRWSD